MAWTKRAQADPDPNPGIGGYRRPRGPYGEDGYPGSTAATRQNPQAAADRLHNAAARPAAAPPFGRGYARRRMPSLAVQRANVIPAPAHQGGLPYRGGPVNPDRVRDTERRPRVVISAGIPGGQRQRNTVYRGGIQARPGDEHTYRSASKGRGFPITESTMPSRYVYGGPNGGTDNLDDLMTARRMPYTGHGDHRGRLEQTHARGSARGAVLDGTRLYLRPVTKDTRVAKQGGAYGKRIRGSRRHRPTIFNEPAGWAGRFYDTTGETGTPDRPGANTQVVPNVHVSPRAATVRRSWGARRG